MKVACHHCHAANEVEDGAAAGGSVQLTCVRCSSMLWVAADGAVYDTEGALRQAQGNPEDEHHAAEAYATIPLPALGELGLNPRPAKDPPPPRPGSIADVDLDSDDEPFRPAAVASTSQTSPPRASTAGRPDHRVSQLPRYTLSVPVPPVSRHGWMVFAAVFVIGILLGGLLFGGSAPSQAAFNEASGRTALAQASVDAIECFSRASTPGVGTVSVLFLPNGEASQVTTEGPLAESERRRCVEKSYADTIVPAFAGPPVLLRQRVNLGTR